MDRHLVFHGTAVARPLDDIEALFDALEERRVFLHRLLSDDLITFFDALTASWNARGATHREVPVKNIVEFFARDRLAASMRIALHGDYHALDRFIDLGDPALLLHAQPRGLTVHWLAGNVAILGIFSIFSALLTKNVCLVKASARAYTTLVALLQSLADTRTDAIDGAELARCIAVILLDRADRDAHAMLSVRADVRVAWGGRDAIETVLRLEKRVTCEDIIFGPKYSYACIDRDALARDGMRLARRLAVDASVFDQEACASPHTVFVEGTRDDARRFAELLAHAMDVVHRTVLPKEPIAPGKSLEVLRARTAGAMTGTVIQSAGTEWTVIVSEEPGLAPGCASRVVVVKPIRDLAAIAAYNDRRMQTLGLGLTTERKRAVPLSAMTRLGIDRCPDLGRMTFYESPWDGMFVFDRFVRWVSVQKG